MTQKLVIMDTCDAILTRKSDGKRILSSTTTLANINQTVDENNLQAGIGSSTIAVLSTNKQQSVDLTDALWSLESLEATQGVSIEANGTASVFVKGVATYSGNNATIAALANNSSVTQIEIQNAAGATLQVPVVSGAFTLPAGIDISCPEIPVIWQETVTGQSLSFDSTRFAENYSLQLYTIAYNPDTMQVVKDVYITYDTVRPSGNFSLNFQLGTAITPEMTLQVLKPKCSNELGKIILVDRPNITQPPLSTAPVQGG